MTSVAATFEPHKPTFGEHINSVAKEESNAGLTLNGDFNYKSLGDDVDTMILEMKQKLLNNPIQDALPKDTGHGSKRKGTPGLPKDSTMNMPEYFRTEISAKFNAIMTKIKTLPENEQCLYLDMMFRSIFHERAIPRSGQGKGHKSIMFHMWHEMYKHMPVTSLNLLYLIPEYGCFRDLDNIMHHYISDDTILDSSVVDKCIDVYYSYLCKDFHTLFELDMTTLEHSNIRSRIEETYHKIRKNEKRTTEIEYPRVSLVGKFIGREDKKFSFIREPLLAKIFSKDDYEKYNSSSDGFKRFTQVTLRYFLFILNTIIGTVEMKMSSINYKDIDPTKMTSGASLKYRKYLINVDFNDNVRSHEPEAIALAERTIKAATDNALNGAGLDSVKLANIIGKGLHNSTLPTLSVEMQLINAQFNSLFDSIKKNLEEEYDRLMIIWVEEGSIPENKPLDPFNVMATIDVSGSMECANVMNPAILLGIIVTKLSNLGNSFMTFSDNPTLVTINPEDNIFDIFQKVKSSDWGGSTDIDKANRKLAGMMNDYKKINPDFSGQITHIIFTDGQFNKGFVRGWTDNQPLYTYCGNFNVDTEGPVWNTAVRRMEKYFTDYGLSIPNTVFWNMSANSPGFPTTGDMKGLQLAEGLSHGILVSILTNACEYTADETGVKKAGISPIESFHKTIYHPYFDEVTKMVHHTKEGVYENENNRLYAANFMEFINS